MRRLAVALATLFLALSAYAGQNPDINIFLEFDNGENRIDPMVNDIISVYVCFENFGSGGGMTGAEFRFDSTFGRTKIGQLNLLGSIDVGDPEDGDGWTITAPSCVFPDGAGVVVAARVDYLYESPPGVIEVLPHGSNGANVADCFGAIDTWCVRLDPAGLGGVWMDPPPGDCAPVDPNPHRFDVPSEYATIQAAIDAASAADTVYVAAGTYATSTNGEVFPILLRNGVLVMSESSPESTIVDAEDQDAVFQLLGIDTAELLMGFTITEGSASSGGGFDFFGGPSAFLVEDCVFSGNLADYNGGGVYVDGGTIEFRDCVFADNVAESGSGGAVYGYTGTLTIDLSFTDCEFVGNSADTDGGAAHLDGYTRLAPFTGCTFTGNTAGVAGGALAGGAEVLECEFTDNSAPLGGAVYDIPSARKCVFRDNTAGDGEAAVWAYSIARCTIVGNSPHALTDGFSFVTVDSTIVAFNTGGEPVICPGGSVTMSCSDVFGNAGGDWVGCIAGQDGANGNVSLNPLFCDQEAGDLSLCSDSPCAEENNPTCGQIGALGIGCQECGKPAILSVLDVPGDQGRFARVIWDRSGYDAPGGTVHIAGYELHRRHDARAEHPARVAGLAPEAPRAGPPRMEGWDFIATIPAHGDPTYQYVSPTVCDSTAEGGICWSVFLVRAATDDPFLYFDSPPDSGYSVDNLAPEAPANLVAEGEFDVVALAWDPNEEEDLDYYAVYRDTVEDFVPTEPIGYTTGEAYEDASPPVAPELWYRVTAFDFSGNESEPSSASGLELTGIESGTIPTALVLRGNFPNPFTPSTRIEYGLPRAATVTLTIYDVSGRVVRRLVTGSRMEAGTHTVRWDGRDDAGRIVPSGVYVYTLVVEEETLRRRMLLLK